MSKLALELLKKYGLPTAFLAVVSAFAFWLVRETVFDMKREIAQLSAEIDHVARIVDLSCRPRE